MCKPSINFDLYSCYTSLVSGTVLLYHMWLVPCGISLLLFSHCMWLTPCRSHLLLFLHFFMWLAYYETLLYSSLNANCSLFRDAFSGLSDVAQTLWSHVFAVLTSHFFCFGSKSKYFVPGKYLYCSF